MTEDFYEKLVQSVQMDCARKIQKTATALCSVLLNNTCLRYLGHSPEQKYKNIHA